MQSLIHVILQLMIKGAIFSAYFTEKKKKGGSFHSAMTLNTNSARQ